MTPPPSSEPRRATIRDLGLIGNRRTLAAIDRHGAIVWYCPGRFDRPSLFASLFDDAAGGWELRAQGVPAGRRYLGESAVLETRLQVGTAEWCVRDWMPLASKPATLCRQLDSAPVDCVVELRARPDYARDRPQLAVDDGVIRIGNAHWLYASAPAEIIGDSVRFHISAGQPAWFVLADGPLQAVSAAWLDSSLRDTLDGWERLHQQTGYAGPYQREVKDSLRALRLLTHEETGGIIAAGTLGLPEVASGSRNYDYRYVWLRDAAMIVSALIRSGSKGGEENRFLDFLCSARNRRPDSGMGSPDPDATPPPFLTLDGTPPPPLTRLDWHGYQGAQPVCYGNGAGRQLQLDGIANVLLAAKQIYNRGPERPHWDTVTGLADFLVARWREPDHGIWEESRCAQYTTGKVVSAVALRFLAEHSGDDRQAQRWRATSAAIGEYVEQHCRTADGAYSVVAGEDAVDVSAALFPVWDYCPADSPTMQATIARLERDASDDGLLYRRHLECFDASNEGAFLAGTLWVAQYWVMRGELGRAERILEAALRYSNDLGLFAEEADVGSRAMLGNVPQAFVHAALIGLVVDIKAAREATADRE